MTNNLEYVVLKWTGVSFEPVKALASEEIAQIIILQNKNLAIAYIPNLYGNIEKINMNRQMDSIKRTGIQSNFGKLKVDKIESVTQFLAVRNAIRAYKMGKDIYSALEMPDAHPRDMVSSNDAVNVYDDDQKKAMQSVELMTYNVRVDVHRGEIRAYDLRDNNLLVKKALPGVCASIEPMMGRQKKFKLEMGSKTIDAIIDLLEKVSEVKTDSLYIVNIHYDNENNIGFYIGYYEFGTFTVDDTGTISIKKKVRSDKLTYGWYVPDLKLFIVSKLDKIECWDWNRPEPSELWVAPVPYMDQGLTISSDIHDYQLFTGHRNGEIKKFDIKTGRLIETFSSNSEPIKHMIWENEGIASTSTGVFRFSQQGDIKWHIKMTENRAVVGLSFSAGSVWVTQENSLITRLDPDTGSIEEIFTGTQGEANTRVTILNKEWLVYDYPCNVGWLKIKNPDIRSSLDEALGDTIIRSLTPIANKGVLIGENHGKLIYLRRPGIILKEL